MQTPPNYNRRLKKTVDKIDKIRYRKKKELTSRKTKTERHTSFQKYIIKHYIQCSLLSISSH